VLFFGEAPYRLHPPHCDGGGGDDDDGDDELVVVRMLQAQNFVHLPGHYHAAPVDSDSEEGLVEVLPRYNSVTYMNGPALYEILSGGVRISICINF